MARRRREGETKPDLGFEIPEFDEGDFIRKETISFRTTLILFLYSIVTAFLTFLVWAFLIQNWFLALLVGLGLGVALRWMYPALKVDVSHFKRKEWTGTGFLYFFSWLAFFIFLTNPPLYDGVEPEVQIHVTPDAQEPGGLVNVTILVLDNVGVDQESLRFTVTGPDGEIADAAELVHGTHTASWRWSRTFGPEDAGEYTVRVEIADSGSGLLQGGKHTTTETTTFRIDGEALQVFLSGATEGDLTHARFTNPGDTVTVRVPDTVDVYRVWLQPEGDDTTRIFLQPADDDAEGFHVFEAEADFQGFQQGNNTFTVHVQEHDSYWLTKRYDLQAHTATLTSSETYTVVIDNAALLGEDTADGLSRERRADPVQAPGPGLAVTLVGILGVAVFVARRRKA